MDVSNTKKQRIAAHTHIKGLGLGPDGEVSSEFCGLFGQLQARKVSADQNKLKVLFIKFNFSRLLVLLWN